MANHRLLRDGVEIKLRPQAFQALHVLVQNSGHEVDYQRMIEEAWAGTWVSGQTVEVTVAEVKKALGEHGFWITRRPKQAALENGGAFQAFEGLAQSYLILGVYGMRFSLRARVP